MSTYTSIQKTSLFRLQAQMAEHRLVRAFRQRGWLRTLRGKIDFGERRATHGVKRIRHWQDGGFITMKLPA
ncbi:hypothetical protein [Aliiroseovarius subalbicans]|uniref:hypothetical protein n=1 Tax=Aliiroseovarius subalbicans TaxID=2925840 RepID=UPI001F56109B|nr:hypothetical protein [Aliiroseovarius subalbicans]MCI2398662.1 hypothetical protein [Aliiroseovarius subalbicans]